MKGARNTNNISLRLRISLTKVIKVIKAIQAIQAIKAIKPILTHPLPSSINLSDIPYHLSYHTPDDAL